MTKKRKNNAGIVLSKYFQLYFNKKRVINKTIVLGIIYSLVFITCSIMFIYVMLNVKPYTGKEPLWSLVKDFHTITEHDLSTRLLYKAKTNGLLWLYILFNCLILLIVQSLIFFGPFCKAGYGFLSCFVAACWFNFINSVADERGALDYFVGPGGIFNLPDVIMTVCLILGICFIIYETIFKVHILLKTDRLDWYINKNKAKPQLYFFE